MNEQYEFIELGLVGVQTAENFRIFYQSFTSVANFVKMFMSFYESFTLDTTLVQLFMGNRINSIKEFQRIAIS